MQSQPGLEILEPEEQTPVNDMPGVLHNWELKEECFCQVQICLRQKQKTLIMFVPKHWFSYDNKDLDSDRVGKAAS